MTEKLSELIDGELRGDLATQLSQIVADGALRQTWSRYHRIGAVLREEHSPLSADFAARFEARLKDEPVILCPQRDGNAAIVVVKASPDESVGVRLWQNLALAASLAAIALLSWHQFGNPAVKRGGPDYVAQLQQSSQKVQQRARPADDLDIYLFEHGQYASVSDLNGLMAYTKFVSYGNGD